VAFQISSLTKIAGSALPAACFPTGAGASYDAGYVITYAPTTTTWSETIAGKTYLTTVTATSPTLYLGLNFVTGGSFGFNDEEALCATSGAGTLYGGGSGQIVASAPASGAPIVAAAVPTGSDAWYTIANDVATNDPGDMTTLVPTVADENSPAAVNYGSFALALQTAALDPPAAKPVLAPTGADAAPAGILGGALLLGGVGAVSFGRRRRVARA
jgi:LPXTG-motif cell wall-anchored protein